ncbi:Broad specificity phosphatase PhoE [Nocardioides scoriae]|uniref:Broad specificity phosphatase PhoE n=1 Tax=Nocardioides scoriae TaxID=642780 RepID=A0A1H1W2L1_9ACTN|nr:histidine phosphatase family protein [Nocardioides scoriae]SDS91313.1 Broad specificity phosphatase PhoE [Nocardioides scoriae]
MGQLLLVRHGQASWDADDYDVLSPTGWEQGRVLGRALAARGVVPDRVVRGSMRRHRETAEAALGELPGAPAAAQVPVDPAWDEFDHVAVLDGMPEPPTEAPTDKRGYQALLEEALESWMLPEHADRYAEPFAAFTGRVDEALRRTTQDGAPGTTAVVTSGGVIAWVTASLLADGDPELATRLWRKLNVVCVNSGLTRLVVGRRGTTLVTFNDHAHLDGLPELTTYR